MFKGLLVILGACFGWGLVFVVPTYLESFSPIEIALSAYFFYGVLSIFFFSFSYKNLLKYPLKIWLKAAWFALIVNIVYYTSIVLGIQYSNAAITTLVAGIAPVSIALYGNLTHKEVRFRRLILPSLLIALGLIIVNLEVTFLEHGNELSQDYFIGIFFAFVGLMSWTWYVVANSKFQKSCPTMSQFEWSTMLGLVTFIWVILFASILAIFVMDHSEIQRFYTWSPELKLFLTLTALIGCFSSWLGSYFWNLGCTLLPVSFCGQLTIFETIFGLTFVYIGQQKMPTILESTGISCMLLAILYSINVFNKVLFKNVPPEESNTISNFSITTSYNIPNDNASSA
jgi:drug/metabolite transporter (DMT)-like permease